jgi:hypothetical protein
MYNMEKINLVLNIDSHDVLESINDAIIFNKPLLKVKGIEIEVDCPEGL